MSLKLVDIAVEVQGKTIIENANMEIRDGDIVLLLGPNGSGKTTLLQAMIGNPRCRIIKGSIYYNDIDITNKPIYERVNMGIMASYQIPPTLRGITLYDLALNILKKRGMEVNEARERIFEYATSLNMTEFLYRNVNLGFSGGELKRSELFLTLLSKPKTMLLDEIDSGIDIENMRVMAKEIMRYYNREKPGILFVTHTGWIAKYLKFNDIYILLDGIVRREAGAEEALNIILRRGFKEA